MKSKIVYLLLLIFIISSTYFAQGIKRVQESDLLWSQEDISNTTIFLFQNNNDSSYSFGTGNIIKHDKSFLLLTASHVSSSLTSTAKIIFRLKGDKPGIYDLVGLVKGDSLDWKVHPVADISIIEIVPHDETLRKIIEKWAFPSQQILSRKELPSREAGLIFLGYPIIDFKPEHFSPLLFKAHRASGYLTQKRADTKTNCTFFYLDTPSIQGCSGSGLYYSINTKPMYIGGSVTMMIGIVHGTHFDNTGGKLAAITPSFYIYDLLADL